METRRKFSREFKLEAVRLVTERWVFAEHLDRQILQKRITTNSTCGVFG
jgi:hypothetical protein